MLRLARASLILGVLIFAAPARADIPPSPTRPAWNDPPAPQPDPPPEKPLERLLVVAAAGGLLALITITHRRRLAGARS